MPYFWPFCIRASKGPFLLGLSYAKSRRFLLYFYIFNDLPDHVPIVWGSLAEAWVQNQLVPFLEKTEPSLKLCLHHRDFEVRKVIESLVRFPSFIPTS
jgi:hypothetical protein